MQQRDAHGASPPAGDAGPRGVSRRTVLAAAAGAMSIGGLPSPAGAATPPVLDDWLRAYPNVAKAVVWDFGKGLQPYAAWAEPAKARLRAAYLRAFNNQPSGLADPPPNLARKNDDEYPATIISGEHAFALHIAHVGNSLATEIGRRVPWSIANYSDPAMVTLLSGFHFFRRTKDAAESYSLVPESVPAPPDATLAFLRANKIVAATPRATIVQMLAWCRDHMSHFGGPVTARNFEDHWQYRGVPPITVIVPFALPNVSALGSRHCRCRGGGRRRHPRDSDPSPR